MPWWVEGISQCGSYDQDILCDYHYHRWRLDQDKYWSAYRKHQNVVETIEIVQIKNRSVVVLLVQLKGLMVQITLNRRSTSASYEDKSKVYFLQVLNYEAFFTTITNNYHNTIVMTIIIAWIFTIINQNAVVINKKVSGLSQSYIIIGLLWPR